MPEIEILAGPVRPIPVPSTSTGLLVLSGDSYLCGWSLRDTFGTQQAGVEGSLVSPAAGAAIISTPTLPAGQWAINWTVGLNGTVSASDANNFELTAGGFVIETSQNPPNVGTYPQAEAFHNIVGSGTLSVKAVGAGTVGATYTASITAVPQSGYLTVFEFTDGTRILGEGSIMPNGTHQMDFGNAGIKVYSGIQLNVISGSCQGMVNAQFYKAS